MILARVYDPRADIWYAVAIVGGHRRWIVVDPPGAA